MLKKVAYSQLAPNAPHRPYLQLLFNNPKTHIIKSNLALVDSGADSTLIPYSLGVELGFSPASDLELQISNGVSGSIHTVKRDCTLALISSDNKKIFEFETEVSWAHPLEAERKKLEDLAKTYADLKNKNIPSTDPKMISTIEDYGKIALFYETNILLGRNFFVNFDFLQFVEKEDGSKSKFIYKVRRSKISKTIQLNQP